MPDTPSDDLPLFPGLDLVPEVEHPKWPTEAEEVSMDESEPLWDGPEAPLEGAVSVMLGTLRELLVATRARGITAPYGYVLTWGLVPENLLSLESDLDMETAMRRTFFVLTPGGEFLPLTRPLTRTLQVCLSRVNGSPLLMDMEPGINTWSTAPGVPITALDVLYIASAEPIVGTNPKLHKTIKENLTARRLDQEIYITLPRRPDGWPP
jgi:hypothetical protein